MKQQPRSARPYLRRQPRVRRIERMNAAATANVHRRRMPSTARRRRVRNNLGVKIPVVTIKRMATSSRWISLSLLAVCAYALFWIGTAEAFYLTLIPVEGVASIPPAEVVEASGLAGAHIFAADPVEAATAIGELPGVISATVTLHWPNQVHIRLGEDSPVIIWEQAGEQYWVNTRGQLVPARIEVPGLLHIRAEAAEPPGDDAFVPADVLAGALQLRQLRPNIALLAYRPSSGLSYQDGRGWQAYFGAGTDMHQKLVVYETLVEELLARQVVPEYISVSNQSRPYYRARLG